MTNRTEQLRRESLDREPSISAERAQLITDFCEANEGRMPVPILRAAAFRHLCEHQTIYLGPDELIVGERGPAPKAVPTYPELTCHSLDDLRVLDSRRKVRYAVDDSCLEIYRTRVIPFWKGRSMRDFIFAEMSSEWTAAYEAGLFTEFMEQRAPGHAVLDGKIYGKGILDFKRDIAASLAELDFFKDPEAVRKREALRAMDLACQALIRFAERHAELAEQLAAETSKPIRQTELKRIATVCRHVPAQAPRDFHEALQYYWFCHLAVITELNGWDAFNPGHLDQHLLPFYERELAEGSLTEASARELLECFFIKFNNHPAPPKVGVTAAESATYTDFANINLGGLLPDGFNGANPLSDLLLEIIDEMHLLQPSSNVQLSRKSPEAFLKHTLRVVRKGYGFPSLFNADTVVEEQIRQGKSLEDARQGGCSGCVEVSAFGKEACILTGYFNLPKVLILALHNGVDPATGQQLGPATGDCGSWQNFADLFSAFRLQLRHFINLKIQGNQIVEQLYAKRMPAPFLSVLIDDCVRKGRDYNDGGARYNNSYIQMVGLGSVTDCLAALKQAVFEEGHVSLPELITALNADFEGAEPLRQRLLNRCRKYGNDDDRADQLMVAVFNACFEEIDDRPNSKGGRYRLQMLPTTCHVYFGSVTGATPDGRHAKQPFSEGISPMQGADRHGPTAVIQSAAKMDHVKTGGTLLNLKFSPSLLAGEDGITKLAHLVRAYFRLDGHHVQFNVVTGDTLRQAQQQPETHRDLIVRVAGYSDYFCDLTPELQNEIIARTEHADLG